MAYASVAPRRRSRRPGSAPVWSSSITTTPFTITISIPSGYWCGSSKVARSAIVSGSKRTRSAALPSDDRAAVREAKRRGRAASHLVDGLRQAEKIEIPGVMSENPRKRSIKSGMRLALPGYAVRRDARTIGADHDERVGEDRSHIVLRHRAHQDPGGAAIGDDQVTGDIERILAALAGEVVDCLARFRGR